MNYQYVRPIIYLLVVLAFLVTPNLFLLIDSALLNLSNVGLAKELANCLNVGWIEMASSWLMPGEVAMIPRCSIQEASIPTSGSHLMDRWARSQGLRMLARGDYEGAVLKLGPPSRSHPDDRLLRLFLGFAYAGLGDEEEARREWIAVKYVVNRIISQMDGVFWATHDLAKVEPTLLALAKYDPYNPYLYRVLAYVYWNSAQPDRAADAFELAIQYEPDEYQRYVMMGERLNILGRYEEACDTFSRAIELQPLNWLAYSRAADSYGAAGRYAEAVRMLEIATRLHPSDASIQRRLESMRAALASGEQ